MTSPIVSTNEDKTVQQAVTITNHLDEARRLSYELRVALIKAEKAIESDHIGSVAVGQVQAIRGSQKLIHDAINREYSAWLNRAVDRGRENG